MYVRGYLQGSENGRVVTIAEAVCRKVKIYVVYIEPRLEKTVLQDL
jgi:hypothetical protein